VQNHNLWRGVNCEGHFMLKWEVFSSHKFEGVITSIEFNKIGIAISNEKYICFLDFDGNQKWKTKMPFKPYKIRTNEHMLGVLMGNGFVVIDSNNGEQLHEGRSTQGGFSDIINRPGGGWILSDRHEQLHIFNNHGFGIKRLFSGKIRKLLGWIDRDHLIIHDGDGCLRCIRLKMNSTQRHIEDRVWSWSSELKNGEVLVQSLDGNIWKGKPNISGWDSLELFDENCLEPFKSIWTIEGWWILDMENKIFNNQTTQNFENFGDIIASNSNDLFSIANREGLIRIIGSGNLIKKKKEKISFEYEKMKLSLNSEKRDKIFKMAKNAELMNDFEKANELFKSIGIEYEEGA